MANDILLNDDYSPVLQDGDFVVGESEDQEVWLLLSSKKGEWKFSPTVGADLVLFQNSLLSRSQQQKSIRQTLKQDGFRTVDIEVKADGSFKVKAFRNG